MRRKRCTKCGRLRLIKFFTRDKTKSDNYHAWCKDCKSKATQEWNKNNRKRAGFNQWAWQIRKQFGIEPSDYQHMLDRQDGGCAICGKTPARNKKRLSVDHDHKTGLIRGLLCGRCNYYLLGRSKVTPEVFRRAADYLEKGGLLGSPRRFVPSKS